MSNSTTFTPLDGTILLLGTQMEIAGAQKDLLLQAEWLHQRGQRTLAVFLYDKQNLAADWSARYPFPVINLNAFRPGDSLLANASRFLAAMSRLWGLLRGQNVQVIEALTPDSNLVGIPLAWLAGVPVRIPTHHGQIDNRPGWFPRLHGWLVNSRLSSCLVAVSARVKRRAIEIEGVRPEKVEVILNGIDLPPDDPQADENRAALRAELGVAEGGHLAIMVGRLTRQKGHTFLLHAIPIILAEHPNTVFALAGDGELRAELEAEAAERGVGAAVRFLGIRRDVPDLLRAADLYLMPSLWEGLPLSLLEAMTARLPVVVSDVEGIDDVLTDGQEGRIVPVGDPAALAAAINALLADPAQRAVYGQAARATVERDFSIDRMCEDYWGVFEKYALG